MPYVGDKARKSSLEANGHSMSPIRRLDSDSTEEKMISFIF